MSVWMPPLMLLPTFATAGFLEFSKLVVSLSLLVMGRVVHLFVIYGYQGAEDAEKLQLTDKLLQAVLAESKGGVYWSACAHCCDLHADLAVIPCLAKAISEGRFVDLALAYSLGERERPAATCKFKLDECSGTRRDFILGCSNAVAASIACRVTDR